MTDKEIWRIAGMLAELAAEESWQTLRSAIYDAMKKARDTGPHYSLEAVQSLKERISELESGPHPETAGEEG